MKTNVAVQNLVKQYGSVRALDGVSLQMHAGEVFGILGPNGAGKTTLIETIVGMRSPDEGETRVLGFDVRLHSKEVRQHIGISLQSAALPPDAKVMEMMHLYASLYDNPQDVSMLTHQFGLEEFVGHRCSKLSGGLQQRLALALAVIGRPEVIFLDEPTTGLDPRSRRDLWTHILALRAEGRTIVLSTHYMEEAESLCDRVAIIDKGRLLALDSPARLIQTYGPERAIEVTWDHGHPNSVDLSRLAGVTGIMEDEKGTRLLTANPAETLLALAQKVNAERLPLGDLRTRNSTLEDVFLSLTGRELVAK